MAHWVKDLVLSRIWCYHCYSSSYSCGRSIPGPGCGCGQKKKKDRQRRHYFHFIKAAWREPSTLLIELSSPHEASPKTSKGSSEYCLKATNLVHPSWLTRNSPEKVSGLLHTVWLDDSKLNIKTLGPSLLTLVQVCFLSHHNVSQIRANFRKRMNIGIFSLFASFRDI